jgi:adenylate cyclase
VALVVLFGFAAPLLSLRFGALRAAGATLAGLVGLAIACQLAFNRGTVVGFVYPAVAAILGTAATLMLNGTRVVFERELVRDTFARFVPESVVGEVLAQADGTRLGGVRREATVLFSDLRGFTSFAEQREPDETIAVLNRYLSVMSDEILEHGGTLVSYMGDGIMAVYGAPIEQPDHAQRALDTARAMLSRLQEFNAELRAEGRGDGFKMGIGLNSGPVMSGNVGSERRLEYTTIGDTTNTASRIEGMTKGTPHQLYISDTTYALLAGPPSDLACVGEFDVRGRNSRVKIWTLADSSLGQTASERPRHAALSPTAL